MQRLFCYITIHFLLRICNINSFAYEGPPGMNTECVDKKHYTGSYYYYVYSGTKDTTKSGTKCVNWSTKYSGDLAIYRNYCRVFTATYTYSPWCYTQSSWEYCGIPSCSKNKKLAEAGKKRNADYKKYASSFKICLGPKIFKYFVYGGTESVTASSKKCANWATTSKLNDDIVTAEGMSYLKSQKNYCRTMNPDIEEIRPWCYTTHKDEKWNVCNIPKCEIYTKCVGPIFMDGQYQYFGNKSITAQGNECVHWNKVTFKDYIHNEELNENYCRVIVGMSQKLPWCYISTTEDKWEFCDIPLCTENETFSEESKKKPPLTFINQYLKDETPYILKTDSVVQENSWVEVDLGRNVEFFDAIFAYHSKMTYSFPENTTYIFTLQNEELNRKISKTVELSTRAQVNTVIFKVYFIRYIRMTIQTRKYGLQFCITAIFASEPPVESTNIPSNRNIVPTVKASTFPNLQYYIHELIFNPVNTCGRITYEYAWVEINLKRTVHMAGFAMYHYVTDTSNITYIASVSSDNQFYHKRRTYETCNKFELNGMVAEHQLVICDYFLARYFRLSHKSNKIGLKFCLYNIYAYKSIKDYANAIKNKPEHNCCVKVPMTDLSVFRNTGQFMSAWINKPVRASTYSKPDQNSWVDVNLNGIFKIAGFSMYHLFKWTRDVKYLASVSRDNEFLEFRRSYAVCNMFSLSTKIKYLQKIGCTSNTARYVRLTSTFKSRQLYFCIDHVYAYKSNKNYSDSVLLAKYSGIPRIVSSNSNKNMFTDSGEYSKKWIYGSGQICEMTTPFKRFEDITISFNENWEFAGFSMYHYFIVDSNKYPEIAYVASLAQDNLGAPRIYKTCSVFIFEANDTDNRNIKCISKYTAQYLQLTIETPVTEIMFCVTGVYAYESIEANIDVLKYKPNKLPYLLEFTQTKDSGPLNVTKVGYFWLLDGPNFTDIQNLTLKHNTKTGFKSRVFTKLMNNITHIALHILPKVRPYFKISHITVKNILNQKTYFSKCNDECWNATIPKSDNSKLDIVEVHFDEHKSRGNVYHMLFTIEDASGTSNNDDVVLRIEGTENFVRYELPKAMKTQSNVERLAVLRSIEYLGDIIAVFIEKRDKCDFSIHISKMQIVDTQTMSVYSGYCHEDCRLRNKGNTKLQIPFIKTITFHKYKTHKSNYSLELTEDAYSGSLTDNCEK